MRSAAIRAMYSSVGMARAVAEKFIEGGRLLGLPE
jgi:hypothetical protein